METPEIERRAVEDYLRSQSGPDFIVEHVEKLTSEYVLGRQYDVWDAHTNEGRWWIITPPTNLYSQDQIRSMDIALSFHIGLMSRMMARESVRFEQNGSRSWVLEVMRRLETASDNLDRAKEVEDVQAVGMRLREALLTLTARLRSLDLQMPESVELPQQDGNFKGWAEVYAGILAPGASSARLRKVLKAQSDHTWDYLGWLTHARNASPLDGRLAYSLTSGLVEAFLLALARLEPSADERCPACSSYQVSRQFAEGGDWIQHCGTCGWQIPTNPPELIDNEPVSSGDATGSSPSGDCVVVEDFGLYITPGQARSILEESAARAVEDEDEQPRWTNPFTVRFPEDGSMRDVHRLVFSAHRHESTPGSELTYECQEDGCVNPRHAIESPMPTTADWHPMLIESAVNRSICVELEVVSATRGRSRIFVEHEFLNRYGLGDASSLVERVVFLSNSDKGGHLWLVPGARRVDHGVSSFGSAWLQPPHQVGEDDLDS